MYAILILFLTNPTPQFNNFIPFSQNQIVVVPGRPGMQQGRQTKQERKYQRNLHYRT